MAAPEAFGGDQTNWESATSRDKISSSELRASHSFMAAADGGSTGGSGSSGGPGQVWRVTLGSSLPSSSRLLLEGPKSMLTFPNAPQTSENLRLDFSSLCNKVDRFESTTIRRPVRISTFSEKLLCPSWARGYFTQSRQRCCRLVAVVVVVVVKARECF